MEKGLSAGLSVSLAGLADRDFDDASSRCCAPARSTPELAGRGELGHASRVVGNGPSYYVGGLWGLDLGLGLGIENPQGDRVVEEELESCLEVAGRSPDCAPELVADLVPDGRPDRLCRGGTIRCHTEDEGLGERVVQMNDSAGTRWGRCESRTDLEEALVVLHFVGWEMQSAGLGSKLGVFASAERAGWEG